MEDYLSFDAGWHANIGENSYGYKRGSYGYKRWLTGLSETPINDDHAGRH